jgi:hypothetical protein
VKPSLTLVFEGVLLAVGSEPVLVGRAGERRLVEVRVEVVEVYSAAGRLAVVLVRMGLGLQYFAVCLSPLRVACQPSACGVSSCIQGFTQGPSALALVRTVITW